MTPLAKPAAESHYQPLMLAIVGLVLTAQLAAVTVDVRLQAETAVVRVSYQLQASDSALGFTLIRLPGQLVWFADQSLPLEEREGLTRIGAAPGGQIVLEYSVQGPLDRIPIPVPEAALPAGSGAVTITITGLDPEARLSGGFPRLVAGSPGEARADLANVPSLIRLPPIGSAWTVATAAQVALLVLLVAGAIILWRRPADGLPG